MRTLHLHDLVPYRDNLASYFERLLLDGALAVQLSDYRRLEIWNYYDVYDYVDIVEEALNEYLEERTLFLSLEDLWLMAEQSKDCDSENRPMKDHVISILESFLTSWDYDYVNVYGWDGWEITLHGELTKEQAKAILRELGLR